LVALVVTIAVDRRDGDRDKEGTPTLVFLLSFSPADIISATSSVPPGVMPGWGDEVGDGRNKGVLILLVGDASTIFPGTSSVLGPIGSSPAPTPSASTVTVGAKELYDAGTEERAGTPVARSVGDGTTDEIWGPTWTTLEGWSDVRIG